MTCATAHKYFRSLLVVIGLCTLLFFGYCTQNMWKQARTHAAYVEGLRTQFIASEILKVSKTMSVFDALIAAQALLVCERKYKVSYTYFSELCNQESTWNPKAFDPKGKTYGVTQMQQPLLREQCKKLGVPYISGHTEYDVGLCIMAAANYLMQGYNKYQSWDAAYRWYNGGPRFKINAGKNDKIKQMHTKYASDILRRQTLMFKKYRNFNRMIANG